MKFVSDLRQVRGFPPCTPISSTNKTDCHDITEILLKVVLNTINQLNHLFIFLFPLPHKKFMNTVDNGVKHHTQLNIRKAMPNNFVE